MPITLGPLDPLVVKISTNKIILLFWALAEIAVKLPKNIGFWIFKCLWNCLMEMLQLGGLGGVGRQGSGCGVNKKIYKTVKNIGVWIFKCLWNCLILMLQLGG